MKGLHQTNNNNNNINNNNNNNNNIPGTRRWPIGGVTCFVILEPPYTATHFTLEGANSAMDLCDCRQSSLVGEIMIARGCLIPYFPLSGRSRGLRGALGDTSIYVNHEDIIYLGNAI